MHPCGTGEMSFNPSVLLGNSSSSHTAHWGQQAETQLLQSGCIHQEAAPLLHVPDLHSFIIAMLSRVHLLCGMSLEAMEALVLSMCWWCPAPHPTRPRSNHLLPTSVEWTREAALKSWIQVRINYTVQQSNNFQGASHKAYPIFYKDATSSVQGMWSTSYNEFLILL